jgi:hypothetical protein
MIVNIPYIYINNLRNESINHKIIWCTEFLLYLNGLMNSLKQDEMLLVISFDNLSILFDISLY